MPGLNYTDEDDKFKLLGNVFEYIENEKVKNILSRKGFRKREMTVKCIKIFFMSVFFNYEISKVIDELVRHDGSGAHLISEILLNIDFNPSCDGISSLETLNQAIGYEVA